MSKELLQQLQSQLDSNDDFSDSSCEFEISPVSDSSSLNSDTGYILTEGNDDES